MSWWRFVLTLPERPLFSFLRFALLDQTLASPMHVPWNLAQRLCHPLIAPGERVPLELDFANMRSPMTSDHVEKEIPSVNQKLGILPSIRASFRQFLSSRTSESKPHPLSVFMELTALARDIDARDPRGLPSLIAAILRPLQSEQILSVAERDPHSARKPIDTCQFFSGQDFFSFFDEGDCLRPPPEAYRLQLCRHIVLSTPWKRPGFVSALAIIGTGKKLGAWRQDPNHRVSLLLPWGIGIVTNGNHSISAGILAGEGEIVPSEVADLSPLLGKVRCDGAYYVDIQSGRPVAQVLDQRIAAVYEIGRLMVRHSDLLHPLASRQDSGPNTISD